MGFDFKPLREKVKKQKAIDRLHNDIYPDRVDVEHIDGFIRIFYNGEIIHTQPLTKEFEGVFTVEEPGGPVLVNRKVRFNARIHQSLELGYPLTGED